MAGTIRIILALACVALATVILVPFQMLAMRTGLYHENTVRSLWHRIVVRALGFRLKVTGQAATQRPLLVVSNHVSWTDISIMASLFDMTFIAKADISRWPVLGRVFRLQRPIYVVREAKRRSGDQAGEIAARLLKGDAVVLFPEGSTGDGNFLLPFKSTLFAAAADAAAKSPTKSVFLQPVAINYTHVDGLAMGRQHRRLASWIGDAEFGPHMLSLLRIGSIDVDVRFGEPMEFAAGTDRKELMRRSEQAVQAAFEAILREPARLTRRR